MELKTVQKQIQTLSPQMIQVMKVLQMSAQELQEYVDQMALENPVLELPDPPPEPSSVSQAARELGWLERSDRQNAYYFLRDTEDAARDPLANLGQFLSEEEELGRYILSQFLGTDLEPAVLEAIRFLIEHLDDDGWLCEDMDDLTALSGFPRPVMDRALIELQAAEPAGVGARSLSECLQLQIQRWSGDHRLSLRIVADHLDDLARGHYRHIAQVLGAEESDVRDACDFVRTLDPRPARGFASRRSLSYIIPDVEILRFPDHFEFSLNGGSQPRLSLSPFYLQLMEETGDPDVRAYLSERAEQAKWVVKSIQQRHDTLLRCVRAMVEYQEGFFRLGPGHLLPLTMEQLADKLGVHASTVSRTVREKYLQCDWGVYPLSYLFSRSISVGDTSTEAAKALLKRLVGAETSPLSDQKLCEEMTRQGCPIARRTVAKYREELGIPSASQRRDRRSRSS